MVVFLSTPQWWFPHRNDAELGWGPIAHLVGNAYMIWGLAFLVVVGLRAARLGRSDLGGDPERPVILDGVLTRGVGAASSGGRGCRGVRDGTCQGQIRGLWTVVPHSTDR